MNSVSLGKTRRRAVKRVIFLFVFALVTLAYVATPLTAFACDGNGNGNGGAGIGASDKQAIADLKKGTGAGEQLTDVNGTSIKFTDLKQGQKFKVNFADGVSLDAEFVGNGKAVVKLPSGKLVICQPQPDGTAIVTPKNGASDSPAVANSDKQTITQLRKSSLSGKLQLFRTNSTTPIKLSALQRVGQKFKIKIKGNFLNAVYRGNNQASVTLLSGQKIIISLVQDSIS